MAPDGIQRPAEPTVSVRHARAASQQIAAARLIEHCALYLLSEGVATPEALIDLLLDEAESQAGQHCPGYAERRIAELREEVRRADPR